MRNATKDKFGENNFHREPIITRSIQSPSDNVKDAVKQKILLNRNAKRNKLL